MRGYIALKNVDKDFFEKCKLLEKEILLGMQRLGYHHEIDFEISIISWCKKDIINKSVSNCYYIAADTTYNLYHPKFIQLYKLDAENKLFKYSETGLYEDDKEDALKIVELINAGKLKINYVNSDLLPILNKETTVQGELCSKVEKNGATISIYNNSNSELIEKVFKSL